MYNNKLEYIRRKIKRTHKRYTGERTDGKASLADVAKFFNIPIEETRMQDYIVKKIDYKTPSIEILDKKNNTSYTAAYTYNANLLNYSGGEVKFINTISINPIRKIESLYYIGSETPIITKMTFTDGEYELVIEKEMANSVSIFNIRGVTSRVIYVKNITDNGDNLKQPLLTRIFTNKYTTAETNRSFEQFYTYGPNHLIEQNDSQNKYTYIIKNNVIYGINNFEQKDGYNYLRGICFEGTNVNIKDYLPYNIYAKNKPKLTDEKNVSAIIFEGSTDDSNHHTLEIYKNSTSINVKYNSKKYFYEPNYHRKQPIHNQQFQLPLLIDEKISSEELKNIIAILQTKFKDDKFIELVSEELSIFANKIDIRKGLVQEELDPLSPQLLTDKTFEEISNLISSNKEDYFKLISEQFYLATHISKAKENRKTRTLKPQK